MEWRPIETAPKIHAEGVIAYEPTRGDIVTVTWLTSENVFGEEEGFITGWYVSDGKNDPIWYRYQHQFTHWMPPPAPPLTALA